MEKCPVVPEAQVQFGLLLENDLGPLPWKTSAVHRKQYFRTTNENLQSDLIQLKKDGWFGSTTTQIWTKIKVFNGFTGTWITLIYTFDQSSAGGVLLHRDVTTSHLILTNNTEILFQLVFLWVFILLGFWEPIREVTLVRKMKKNMDVVARSQTGYQMKLKFLDYGLYYIKNRGFILVIKIIKLTFVLFLLYRMLAYPIVGPPDVLEASNMRNSEVPESSTIAHNLTLFVVSL